MNIEKLKVGQTLWWVPTNRGSGTEVTVTAVGRKWARLDNHKRIDVETLEADGAGYAPPGRCHRSRELYEAEALLDSQWGALRKALDARYRVPKGVTLGQIEQARELLGL